MNKTAWAAFLTVGLVWGSNFLFVKWAAESITPAQVTLCRTLFGFLPVFIYALLRGELRWAHSRHVHHFTVMALLATAFYYYAFAHGTALLSSSIAGLLSGSIPLFTFLCAYLFLRQERITLMKAMGVGLGFLGVLLIAQPWSNASLIDPLGIIWMILGALSVGSSFVYAKKFISPLKLPAAALTTYQIGIAGCLLSIFIPYDGVMAITENTRAMLGLVVGLGIVGTGLAYVAYYYIVEKLGALVASSSTYIPPVVALVIGVFWVGESITPSGYLAMALIMSGVALIQFGDQLLLRCRVR